MLSLLGVSVDANEALLKIKFSGEALTLYPFHKHRFVPSDPFSSCLQGAVRSIAEAVRSFYGAIRLHW